jgi:Fe-S-cluster containining protein
MKMKQSATTIKNSEIETNLISIKMLSRKKERENWEFRTFLKGECTAKRLDSVVHRLYREITAEIDCTACANCCRKITPVLDQEDIEEFAQGLRISPKELIDQYMVKDEKGFSFSQTPCPFLHEKRCTNYGTRPKDCQSFPHLHKDDMIGRLMGVVENYGICPIVFNVYEGLKRELWSRRRLDSVRASTSV